MFFLELLTWIGASVALVTLHVAFSRVRHPRLGLTFLTGAMFACVGGLIGTFAQLNVFERGEYSLIALGLSIGATLAYLFLEWAGSHDHLLAKPR